MASENTGTSGGSAGARGEWRTPGKRQLVIRKMYICHITISDFSCK